MPVSFDLYINQIDNIPVVTALRQTQDIFQMISESTLNALADKIYAPGKWTVKDIIQHLVDMERVLAYRALMFARNNPTPQPSIDEEIYANYAEAEKRDIQVLVNDFRIQRESTINLFESFNLDMVHRSGIAAGYYANWVNPPCLSAFVSLSLLPTKEQFTWLKTLFPNAKIHTVFDGGISGRVADCKVAT